MQPVPTLDPIACKLGRGSTRCSRPSATPTVGTSREGIQPDPLRALQNRVHVTGRPSLAPRFACFVAGAVPVSRLFAGDGQRGEPRPIKPAGKSGNLARRDEQRVGLDAGSGDRGPMHAAARFRSRGLHRQELGSCRPGSVAVGPFLCGVAHGTLPVLFGKDGTPYAKDRHSPTPLSGTPYPLAGMPAAT